MALSKKRASTLINAIKHAHQGFILTQITIVQNAYLLVKNAIKAMGYVCHALISTNFKKMGGAIRKFTLQIYILSHTV